MQAECYRASRSPLSLLLARSVSIWFVWFVANMILRECEGKKFTEKQQLKLIELKMISDSSSLILSFSSSQNPPALPLGYYIKYI